MGASHAKASGPVAAVKKLFRVFAPRTGTLTNFDDQGSHSRKNAFSSWHYQHKNTSKITKRMYKLSKTADPQSSDRRDQCDDAGPVRLPIKTIQSNKILQRSLAATNVTTVLSTVTIVERMKSIQAHRKHDHHHQRAIASPTKRSRRKEQNKHSSRRQ